VRVALFISVCLISIFLINSKDIAALELDFVSSDSKYPRVLLRP
jgi:hypothetical protein